MNEAAPPPVLGHALVIFMSLVAGAMGALASMCWREWWASRSMVDMAGALLFSAFVFLAAGGAFYIGSLIAK